MQFYSQKVGYRAKRPWLSVYINGQEVQKHSVVNI